MKELILIISCFLISSPVFAKTLRHSNCIISVDDSFAQIFNNDWTALFQKGYSVGITQREHFDLELQSDALMMWLPAEKPERWPSPAEQFAKAIGADPNKLPNLLGISGWNSGTTMTSRMGLKLAFNAEIFSSKTNEEEKQFLLELLPDCEIDPHYKRPLDIY